MQQTGQPEYVVRVFGKTKAGDSFSGTGFFVNPEGDVATCWHVVRGAREIFVALPYAKPGVYDLLEKDEVEDLALLRTVSGLGGRVPTAMLYPQGQSGTNILDKVIVWGYSSYKDVPAAQAYECTVSGFSPSSALIYLNGSVNPGDSGGPVLNKDGLVVGNVRFNDSTREGIVMVTPVSRLHKLLKASGVTSVVQALVELRQQSDDPRVGEALRAAEGVIRKASQQIMALTTFKEVHDLLHDVQYGCYDRLVLDAQRFADDEFTRDQMSLHASELKRYASTADEIAMGAVAMSVRIRGIRDQLKEISLALEMAYQKLDKSACDRAVELLSLLVMGPTPSVFNQHLNDAARELNLEGLVAVMQGAGEALATRPAKEAKAERVQRGVEDLANLGRELSTLIKLHDAWQMIDDKLRFLYGRSDLLSSLEAHWPGILADFDAVRELSAAFDPGGACDAPAPDWTDRLAREVEDLGAALGTGAATLTRRQFVSLRQATAGRFHRVDKRLLQACEKIGKVKGPLQSLVEILK